MKILTKLFGIFLMFLGIYFLGKNIYFTNSYYSGWRGLKAGSSVLLLTGGIGMLFLLPKDMKLLGYIAIGIGIMALSALWGKLYLKLHFFLFPLAFCLLPFAFCL